MCLENTRLVSELSLPHFLKVALMDNGYKTFLDLAQVTAGDLSIELSIGLAQAEDILRQYQSFRAGPSSSRTLSKATTSSQIRSTTATDLLTHGRSAFFSTLCLAIDRLVQDVTSPLAAPHLSSSSTFNLKGKARASISGVISPGMLIEIAGPPGGGKTGVALGIALSGRLGMKEGGILNDETSEVLLIDTEGSISPTRVHRAAQSLSAAPQAVLSGMHLIRVATQVQMVALLHNLNQWLENHPKVKLIVIDTLSFHFRQPTLDTAVRRRIMELIKHTLGMAATIHGCAVIITNQLATKLLTVENKPATFETGDRAVLMPQLGDAWTTERTIRILLFRGGPGDDLRYAYVSASSTPGLGNTGHASWALFDIDHSGLPCDVPPIPPETESMEEY